MTKPIDTAALNKRLARAMGWTFYPYKEEDHLYQFHPGDGTWYKPDSGDGLPEWDDLPDFASDPAASRELVQWMAKDWPQWKAFFSELSKIVLPQMVASPEYLARTNEAGSRNIGPSQAEWAFAILTASEIDIALAADAALAEQKG